MVVDKFWMQKGYLLAFLLCKEVVLQLGWVYKGLTKIRVKSWSNWVRKVGVWREGCGRGSMGKGGGGG